MSETVGCERSDDKGGDDARGVSDLVGFVLTFSLIVLMVGLIYTAGVDELRTAKNVEHANNAERAFTVLGENVDDLVQEGAPSRATSVELSGSQVRFGDPVTFNVTFTATGASYLATVDPIVYDLDSGAAVVYANGAVLRDQRAGDVMVREPPFVFGTRTIVPYIKTRGGASTRSGQTTALVRTTLASRGSFVRRTDVSGDVLLTIDSPRAAAWARYVEEEAGAACAVSAGQATCTLSPERVYVPLAKVDVRLI